MLHESLLPHISAVVPRRQRQPIIPLQRMQPPLPLQRRYRLPPRGRSFCCAEGRASWSVQGGAGEVAELGLEEGDVGVGVRAQLVLRVEDLSFHGAG